MSGEELRELRERLDLSRSALAGFFYLSEMTLFRWEKNGVPDGLYPHLICAIGTAIENSDTKTVRAIIIGSSVSAGNTWRQIWEILNLAKMSGTGEKS